MQRSLTRNSVSLFAVIVACWFILIGNARLSTSGGFFLVTQPVEQFATIDTKQSLPIEIEKSEAIETVPPVSIETEKLFRRDKRRQYHYDEGVWTPRRPGIYNWSSVPPGLRPALELLFPAFSSVVPVVGSIKSTAGGSADRIRGLPTVACLALLTGRPLAVDPEYLSAVLQQIPAGSLTQSLRGEYGIPAQTQWGPGYYYGLNMAQPKTLKKRWKAISQQSRNTPNETIIVISNTPPGDMCSPEKLPMLEGFNVPETATAGLEAFRTYCFNEQYYSCGALLLHAAWGSYQESFYKVDKLEKLGAFHSDWTEIVLPDNTTDYVMLHMRASSSRLNISHAMRWWEVTEVKSVPFGDGGLGGKSRAMPWLTHMTKMAKAAGLCKAPLVVSSDSARFMSELSFALWPAARIANCCASPHHISKLRTNDTTTRDAAERQVMFDLISMSRAKLFIRTAGGFGFLGQRFLRYLPNDEKVVTVPENLFPAEWKQDVLEPTDICCSSEACIQSAVERLKQEMQCGVQET